MALTRLPARQAASALPPPHPADVLGMRSRTRRSALILAGLAVAALLSLLICLGIGPVQISPLTTAQVVGHRLGLPLPVTWEPSTESIVWQVRLPRVLMGAAVGACLAISGATLQAMVRNLLADPYILGVSGGASTGAAAAILFGVGAAMGEYAQSVLAFVGALGAALAVFMIARAHGRVTSLRLLLSGVAVGYALSAVTSLLIFSSDSAEGSRSVMFWMLGSLSLGQWNAFLAIALGAALLGTLVLAAGSAGARCARRGGQRRTQPGHLPRPCPDRPAGGGLAVHGRSGRRRRGDRLRGAGGPTLRTTPGRCPAPDGDPGQRPAGREPPDLG